MSSTLAGGYFRPSTAPPARGVGHRGGLDRRLAAVEEAVEHLRVQAAALGLLGRQAVVAPHGFGRGLREVRQPLVAAAGGHHREAAGAGPVDQVADHRRLVAVGQAVHHAGLGRTPRQQRAAERVGLHRDVDDMLALPDRGQDVVHRRHRGAGALDHDVDLRQRHQRLPVVGDPGAAFAQRGLCRRGGAALGRPAHARQVALRGGGVQVRDGHQVHARRARHLRQVHRAELAGADQAHPDRASLGGALLKLVVQAHGSGSSWRTRAA